MSDPAGRSDGRAVPARRGGRPAGGRVAVVIAGGGTAGHVLPALAVAGALVERGTPAAAIRFIGSRRGVEGEAVRRAGFEIALLAGRGVERRISWAALVALVGLTGASVRAAVLLARWRPAVVLSVGGYAAWPACAAALVLRVPLVLAEANAVPGAANRISARWARAAAVAFPDTGLPRAVLTGNPVRPEVRGASRAPAARATARAELGLPDDRAVVVVTGGSLGARRVNEAVLELAERWADRRDVAIHHVIGRRDWAGLAPRVEQLSASPAGLWYRAVPYEDRIPALLSAADVWVGRAGGTTMAELTAVGVASLLVPLPIAPHDHQAVGARRLEAAGGCVVVLDADCSGARLDGELGALLADAGGLRKMAEAAAACGHPDAAERIAELLEEHRRD